MALNFGASTFSFMRQEPALQSVRRLRAIGYRMMDVLVTPEHLWPEALDARARSEMRRALDEDDIVIDSLNPQPVDLNVGSGVKAVRDYSVSFYADVIRLARELGARAVVVVPGRVPIVLPPNAVDTMRWAADSIVLLSEVARETGLETVLLENHPMTAFPTAQQLCALVDRTGRDNVRIAYDVANAEFICEDQIEAIALIGGRLGQTHMSDGAHNRWAHDPIGTGTVRFEAIIEALKARGHSAANIVELYTQRAEEDFRAAAQALKIPLAS
jgi:L-ribulose-5-phosphate 3-epimerase